MATYLTAYADTHDMGRRAVEIMSAARMQTFENTMTIMWVRRDMLDGLTVYENQASQSRSQKKPSITKLKR